MSDFSLTLDCGNAAFGESPDERAAEVARILRQAARWIESGEMDGVLRDTHGNRVGTFSLAVTGGND